MRILVAGGAGFIGGHLCRRMVDVGHEVIVVDDLSSGRVENLVAGARFLEGDVAGWGGIEGELDFVVDLASPASPMDYGRRPVETLRANGEGVLNLLGLAKRCGAGFLLASTSEVYGDPVEHPQTEGYVGRVSCNGPRSMYDEGKRYAEAAAAVYARGGMGVKVARIFNVYGEGMRLGDGRVVPNFMGQALRGEDLTIYGDGEQTRSLCYVGDMVDGLMRLMESDFCGTMNLGNPEEVTVNELAGLVLGVTGSKSGIRYEKLPIDDPRQRCPDIGLARRELGWEPVVGLKEGLGRAVEYFRGEVARGGGR